MDVFTTKEHVVQQILVQMDILLAQGKRLVKQLVAHVC